VDLHLHRVHFLVIIIITHSCAGVRRVTSLAPSAFLASAASTDVLRQQLLLHSPMVAITDTAVSLVKNIMVISSAQQSTPDRSFSP